MNVGRAQNPIWKVHRCASYGLDPRRSATAPSGPTSMFSFVQIEIGLSRPPDPILVGASDRIDMITSTGVGGEWCVEKRRRLKSRLQKSEEEIPKIGLWIRLTRKQSAKRCSTRQLPTPFQPAMRHRPCRIQAKILSRSRHRKAFQFSK